MTVLNTFLPYILYIFYLGATYLTIRTFLKNPATTGRHRLIIYGTGALLLGHTQYQRYLRPLLDGDFALDQHLPLFICRVAALLLLVYLIFGLAGGRMKVLRGPIYFFGATALFAVLIPAGPVSGFTELSRTYIIDHYLLAVFPFFLLGVEDYEPNEKAPLYYATGFAAVLALFLIVDTVVGFGYYFFIHESNVLIAHVPGINKITFIPLHALGIYLFFKIMYNVAHRYHDTFKDKR